MKNFTCTLFLFTFLITSVSAQYTTPGTGVDWTLADIATASPTTITVSGSTYTLLEDIIIAPNDILRIDTDLLLEIESGVRVTVFGSFFVEANATTITAVNPANPYNGFRFEEFSEINIQNATLQYGGGLQVLTETFTLNNCVLTNNVSGVTTGATVTISRGMPVITNNEFLFNANPAISSGANQSVSAIIANNYIEGNNQTNNNRPQINMGATRVQDTLKILNNTIIGDRDMDQAGGIAVANLVGGTLRAIIEGNTIVDNRYGITVVGPNSYALIKDNIIEDNDTQGNPNLGGSGINLNAPTGGMEITATGNKIRRNLWGVTIQGPVDANFGDDSDNMGINVFSENGNNGETFALFNNGPNTILAKNNCWVEDGEGTLEEAEGVIFHMLDDATLGEVIFDPIFCETIAGIEDVLLANFMFYPNPAKDVITFNNNVDFQTLEIYDVQGKRMYSGQIFQGANSVDLNLPAGMYFATFSNDQHRVVRKLLVK